MDVVITPEDPNLPFLEIERAAEQLNGKVTHLTCLNSQGQSSKKIVIELWIKQVSENIIKLKKMYYFLLMIFNFF